MADILDDHFNVLEDDVRNRVFDTIEALFPDAASPPDLREGELIWTMTAPVIKEIVEFYSDLNETLLLSFLQYTSGEFLDAKGVEIGLTRIAATPSKGVVRFLGDGGTIVPSGTTVTTTAEDANDPVFQFDSNTYEPDGVTVIPPSERTITAVPDPIAKNAQQRISLAPAPTGGSFNLDFNGNIASIDYNDDATAIQGKLEALPLIGVGNVSVTGGALPYVDVLVEFKNLLGNSPQTLMFSPSDTLTPLATTVITVVDVVIGTAAKAVPAASITPNANINGSAMYKYTWVSVIGDIRTDVIEPGGFGETAGSPASDIVTLTNTNATVTIEAVPSLTGLNEISQVRLYRSFNDGSGFTDYKLVKTVDALTGGPMVIEDDVTNLDFEVIETILQDVNTTGVVELDSTCNETGAATDIAARAISLLDDIVFGVEKVTNPVVFSGGQDEESDDAYRARLLEEIQKPPGAGNIADYEGWAKSIAGVGGAVVIPEWEVEFGDGNGPGTVKVILSGTNNDKVNSTVIEDVRQYISGDVALPSPRAFFGTLTPEYGVVSTAVAGGGSIDPGQYQYVFTFVNVGGGETPHSGVRDDLSEDNSMMVGGTLGITVATTGHISLTNIPVPGPSGVGVQNTLSRRIYRRNLGNVDTKFYLVGTLPDNTTTSFVDAAADIDIYTTGTRYAPIVNSTSLFNGQAPVGAHVTVESISEFTIKVNATIVPASGYNLLGTGGNINLSNAIRLSLKTLFENLAAGSTVYYKDVENAIHDTAGVKDFRLVVLEPSGGGPTVGNITPPNGQAKPVFDSTGVLTEAAV